MTGKITVGTIQDTDGNTVASTYVTNGVAKAHINFNGTGTPAIRDSLNFSSVADGGVGIFTPAYTNNMGNANYTLTTSAEYDGGNASFGCSFNYDGNSGVLSVSSLPLYTFKTNDTGLLDASYGWASIQGDLA